MTLHVVGLDLSLSSTGVTVARPGEQPKVTIVGSPSDDGTALSIHERLRTMVKRISRAANAGRENDDRVVWIVEQPAFMSNTGKAHDRAGLWWLTYHVGRLVEQATMVTVSIQHLKMYATGKGTASKDAVLAAAVRAFPDLDIDDNNLADSTFLAAMGMRELGHPIDITQRVHPAFLDRVDFPVWMGQHRVDLNSRPDRLVGDHE